MTEPPVTSPADAQPSRSVGRNVAALMTSQAITWTLTTAVMWMVPRYLGPVSLGQIRIAMSIWAVAVVTADFGTSTLLTIEVSRRRPTVTALVRNVTRLRTVIFVMTLPFVGAFLVLGPYDRQTIVVAGIYGVASYFGLISTAYDAAMFGLREMGATARVDVLSKITLVMGTVFVLLVGWRIYGIALLAVVVSFSTMVLIVRSMRRVSIEAPTTTLLGGRALITATLPFLASSVTLVVYQQIDTVVMSLLVGEEAIGWYGVADVVFGSLLFVPVIIVRALFPEIADLHERSPGEVVGLLRRSFNSLLLLSIPIGVGTIVVAPSFVSLVYGEQFEESAVVLQVFGVVAIFMFQTILLGHYAVATNRASFWTGSMIVATVASVVLDIVLVPWADERFGNAAIAGPSAYVVTELFLFTIGIVVLAPGLMNRATTGRLVRVGTAGVAMWAASWPLRDMFFVVPGIVGVAVFGVCTLLLGTLDDDEWQIVNRVTGKLPQLLRRR